MNTNQYDYIKQLKDIALEQVVECTEETINQTLNTVLVDHPLYKDFNYKDKILLKNQVMDSMFGYDIIQPLIDDETISEIMINGLSNIFVEKNGKTTLTPYQFSSKDHLDNFVSKIVSEQDKSINAINPIVDCRLSDGSRVNVVSHPIAINGPIVTIRKFKEDVLSIDTLIQHGTLTQEIASFLDILIKSHYNIFVSGATSTGKTTFLNCLTELIPEDERIITIEDAAELKIQNHINLISLETRQSKEHPIHMSKLIKNSLRMKPDRIIVGEVRGEEIIDMLQAMNTGHDGSLSTGHGNSNIDMLNRLLSLTMSSSRYGESSSKKLIISAIDMLIHLKKLPNGDRVMYEISAIDKQANDFRLLPLFSYDQLSNVASRYQSNKENLKLLSVEKFVLWGTYDAYKRFID